MATKEEEEKSMQILLVEQQSKPGGANATPAAGAHLARNLGAGARLAKDVVPTRNDGDAALGGIADQAHLSARATAERAGEVRRLGTTHFAPQLHHRNPKN